MSNYNCNKQFKDVTQGVWRHLIERCDLVCGRFLWAKTSRNWPGEGGRRGRERVWRGKVEEIVFPPSRDNNMCKGLVAFVHPPPILRTKRGLCHRGSEQEGDRCKTKPQVCVGRTRPSRAHCGMALIYYPNYHNFEGADVWNGISHWHSRWKSKLSWPNQSAGQTICGSD